MTDDAPDLAADIRIIIDGLRDQLAAMLDGLETLNNRALQDAGSALKLTRHVTDFIVAHNEQIRRLGECVRNAERVLQSAAEFLDGVEAARSSIRDIIGRIDELPADEQQALSALREYLQEVAGGRHPASGNGEDA